MKKITFRIALPFSGIEVRELLSYVFEVSLVSFFCFYFVEIFRAGFVNTFFNSFIFLWIAIIAGLLTSIWPLAVPEAKLDKRPNWKDYTWIGLLLLATVGGVWYKTSSAGWLVWVITPLSGLIVLGLSLLVFSEKDK